MFWKKEWFEQLAPVLLGLLVLVGCLIARTPIAEQFEPQKWDATNLYVAVFDWAAIQSGFVFGIYGFIVSKRDGFVGQMMKGRSYEKFIGYTRRAYLGGFALTFVSLPLLVVGPDISDPDSKTYMLTALWFASFVWAFAAFLRVAFIFGTIAATPDRPEKVPG